MDYNVKLDQSFGDMEELIKEKTNLILISPYIKNYVDISNIDENKYYILSEKEFLEGNIENIIKNLSSIE